MRGRSVFFLFLLALFAGLPLAVYLLGPRTDRADHLAAARDAIERRDFTTARRELDACLADNPRDPEVRFLAARTARRDGDGTAAESHLKLYSEMGGDRELAELERAMRRSQEGDVSSADAVLRFCAEYPDNPAVPFMLEALARGLLAAGRPDRAVLCLDRWLARTPLAADQAQALAWRGEALEQLGRGPEAIADYRRALEIDPNHATTRFRLAGLLVRDEPLEALGHFERLERAEPGRPEFLLGLARSHRQLGHHALAGQFLARLHPDSTDDVLVLTELGALALDRGEPAAAAAPLRKAVSLAATRREPNVQLLRCLQDLGKESEAAEQREKLKRIDAELMRKIEAIRGKS
jgi:tetratricopeptide (TPR) repeat protein